MLSLIDCHFLCTICLACVYFKRGQLMPLSLAAGRVRLLIVPSWFHVKESGFVDMIPVIGKMCRLCLVCELDKPLLSDDD